MARPLSNPEPPPPPPPPPSGTAASRPLRRRRSALRQPALVDPADLADDATGRVEIFAVEVPPSADPPVARRASPAAPGWWGHVVDGVAGRAALAAVLVAALCVGLLLTR